MARVEKELAVYARHAPGHQAADDHPGRGHPHRRDVRVAWVDDITRFRRTSHLGCYFGLVPCQDASADKNRLGPHRPRRPARVMRKPITEATWTAIKKCPAFRRFFERVSGGKAERRKTALIATAHRLIRVIGAMLRSGQAYDANYKG